VKKYRVWAEIDLDAVRMNLESIRGQIAPGTGIMVVVKADGYGHGAIPISRVAIENGASMIGVGDSNEAISLREAGILDPIIILGALIEEEVGWVVSYDIIPTLHSLDTIPLLEHEAKRQDKVVKVHVKVDTGMSRLGASAPLAIEIARRVIRSPCLVLDGLSTHLSSAAQNRDFTNQQIALFNQICRSFHEAGLPVPKRHVASSSGIFTHSNSSFDMVRPGIAVYGINPGITLPEEVRLHPCMSLHTQICFLKGIRKGTPIGYGMTAVAGKDTRLATIPVGYNDGYPYGLSNKGRVLIRGTEAPVVGTVTMDYTIVDVGHIQDVTVGDEVVLFGKQGKREITVVQIARETGTIPYVITCSLGTRVKRIYFSRGGG
jgi:alanine racemase